MFDRRFKNFCVVGGSEGHVGFLNIKTGEFVSSKKHTTNWVLCCKLLPDNRVASVSDSGNITIWEYNGKTFVIWKESNSVHTGSVRWVTVLKASILVTGCWDGQLTFVGYPQNASDYLKKVKDVKVNPTAQINCVLYHKKNDHFVVAGGNGFLAVFSSFPHVKLVKKLVGHTAFVNKVVKLGRRGWFVSVSDDKTARVWTNNYDCHCVLTQEKRPGNLWSVAEFPNTPYIVTGNSRGAVCLFDWSKRKEVYVETDAHTTFVYSIILVSPKKVLSGSIDTKAKLWRLQIGENKSGSLVLEKTIDVGFKVSSLEIMYHRVEDEFEVSRNELLKQMKERSAFLLSQASEEEEERVAQLDFEVILERGSHIPQTIAFPRTFFCLHSSIRIPNDVNCVILDKEDEMEGVEDEDKESVYSDSFYNFYRKDEELVFRTMCGIDQAEFFKDENVFYLYHLFHKYDMTEMKYVFCHKLQELEERLDLKVKMFDLCYKFYEVGRRKIMNISTTTSKPPKLLKKSGKSKTKRTNFNSPLTQTLFNCFLEVRDQVVHPELLKDEETEGEEEDEGVVDESSVQLEDIGDNRRIFRRIRTSLRKKDLESLFIDSKIMALVGHYFSEDFYGFFKRGHGQGEDLEDGKENEDINFAYQPSVDISFFRAFQIGVWKRLNRVPVNLKLVTDVDKKIFFVHKEVLMLLSNFFFMTLKFPGQIEKMEGGVSNTTIESKLSKLDVMFLGSSELSAVLSFIYYGKIREEEGMDVLMKLLRHSEMYFETDLKMLVRRRILVILRNTHEESKKRSKALMVRAKPKVKGLKRQRAKVYIKDVLNVIKNFIHELPQPLQESLVDEWDQELLTINKREIKKRLRTKW